MIEIAVPIQVALMIGAPLLAGWLLIKRYGSDDADHLRIFLGGILSYAVAQALLLVLSQVAGMLSLPTPPTAWQPFVAALTYGVGIGILEELARFGVLRLWLRDVRSWTHGLMLGVGHGGAESGLSGIMALIWFTTMTSLKNGPPSDQTVTEEERASLQQIVSSYWSQPWPDPVLAAVQQIFVIGLAVGLATLVMRVFITGQIVFLPVAMGLHTVATTTLVFLGQFGIVYSTVAAAGFCVIGLLIARACASPPEAEPVIVALPAAIAGAEGDPPDKKTRPHKKRAKKS